MWSYISVTLFNSIIFYGLSSDFLKLKSSHLIGHLFFKLKFTVYLYDKHLFVVIPFSSIKLDIYNIYFLIYSTIFKDLGVVEHLSSSHFMHYKSSSAESLGYFSVACKHLVKYNACVKICAQLPP